MAEKAYPQVHIFLIQPLRKTNKEMIVYADNASEARKAAAALVSEMTNLPLEENGIPLETVYTDEGLSICIEADPEIIKVSNGSVRVKYNEVIYDLNKNNAEQVIAENIL
jgi:DNA mismatch repair protein MutH